MKKSISLAVWKSLEPELNQYRAYYIPIKNNVHQISLIDIDSESDFFFRLTCESGTYRVEKKPAGPDNINVFEKDVNIQDAAVYLRGWLELLKAYDELVTIYDDPIISYYEKEFMQDFVFDNPDAESKPLDSERQYILLDYLHTIKGLLPAYKENANEGQLRELASIEEEISFLARYAHILSEKDAVKKIVKIWSKARKYSMSLIMEILREVKKEGTKAIAKGFVDGSLMKSLQEFI